ncbi:hypothetical protein ACFVZ3_39830 [Kitasatospora purpeofusca]|uniref:hypothetical protein n=1 Tax=Kitasatospora purpeofusca TaxID=67352 RepID=UPI0036694B88
MTHPHHHLPATAGRTPQESHGTNGRRRPVTRAEAALARRFVDRTETVPLINRALDARRRSPAGRPRTVTVQALLTGMTLASWRSSGRVVLSDVADLLAHRLPAPVRTRLALPAWPDTADGFEAAYLAVRRTFHAVESVMDPSPLPKHRLARTEAAALEAAADRAALDERRALLVQVTNRIVEASLAPARTLIEEYWDGSVAVDATPVRTFSAGRHPTSEHTATDPDAAWYVRDGDHRDPADTVGRKRAKARRALFGYEATLVVSGDTTPAHDLPPHLRLPALALAFTVHKPGHDPAGNALAALEDLNRRGYRPGWLAADRAYSSAQPDTFHLPVHDLGYRPIWDYRRDQLGIQATHAGALLVDGTWYCPHIPAPLITATADLLHKRIDRTTWRHRVDARPAYRLRPKAAPDQRGARRLLCPAAGTHPTAACPVKPRSLGRDPRLVPIDPAPTPGGHPEVCVRESLTFHRDTGIRHWQELDHARTDWVRLYFHLRNRVEHFNQYAKDHEALERSRTRRIRGQAAQSLLLAFQLAHANHRKLATWLDTLQTSTQPARRRPTNRHTPNNPANWTPRRQTDNP